MFYVFRRRGFNFRKTVIYTVIVRYVLLIRITISSLTLIHIKHTTTCFMYLWPCIVSKAWRKNTNRMQQYKLFIVNSRCWLLTTVSTWFGHLHAHHHEKRPRVTAYGLLLVVLDVAVWGAVVLRCRVWALWRLLLEQEPSQCSHPTATFTVLTPYSNLHSAHTLQRSTTVPQPATSNTTSKYTPYAVTRGLFSWWWA